MHIHDFNFSVYFNPRLKASDRLNERKIKNNTRQNPYYMSYCPEIPISAIGSLGPRDGIG